MSCAQREFAFCIIWKQNCWSKTGCFSCCCKSCVWTKKLHLCIWRLGLSPPLLFTTQDKPDRLRFRFRFRTNTETAMLSTKPLWFVWACVWNNICYVFDIFDIWRIGLWGCLPLSLLCTTPCLVPTAPSSGCAHATNSSSSSFIYYPCPLSTKLWLCPHSSSSPTLNRLWGAPPTQWCS